ncbi:MAG: MBL fold metallo-hydrolase [Verrucomicrobiota bacterium]|jgi:glyoxylase-like metal-dependent hydrolase (beta-lactamase superfamily II)|nr:MBL fold metallo-hydrolase [Verrucomicrobiota bacterium]
MQLEVIPVGAYGANCSVLWREPERAWVVDPGADGAALLGVLRERGLTPALVVLTHAHFDHVSAVNDILAAYPVPVYLHEADASMAFSPMNAMPPYPATRRPATLVTDKRDGDTLACGGLSATVIHTPGHTPGGWCLFFAAEKLLVAGDTLFAGSIGRTDFPGGNLKAMNASLQKLKALPDDTRVVCGHGPMTTIGAEKRSNPYLV